MLASRKLWSYAFNTGAGSQTITQEVPHDLSHYETLLIELKVTKADTDAADTLDVALQMTTDQVIWHRRARFAPVLGDTNPSAATPHYQYAALTQAVFLSAIEEVYIGDGGTGGTALTAGTVINGPFPGLVESANVGRLNSARVSLTVTDADSDADYEGTVSIWTVERA